MLREYLIWSNQHKSWLGPNERGYTPFQEAAGRYTFEEALKIVKTATCNGKLERDAWDTNGKELVVHDEVIVKTVEYDLS